MLEGQRESIRHAQIRFSLRTILLATTIAAIVCAINPRWALLAIVVAVCLLFLVLYSLRAADWNSRRSFQIAERWAKKNQLKLMAAYFHGRGPFSWRLMSSAQTVYRVELADSSGAVRCGWLRCGSLLRGLRGDHADILWDRY
jgi:hypothetical protein